MTVADPTYQPHGFEQHALVMPPTPTPPWLAAAWSRLEPEAERIRSLPLGWEFDSPEWLRYSEQLHDGIIADFQPWLWNIRNRLTPGSPEWRFFHKNGEHEALHAQWWREQSEFCGVSPGVWDHIELRPAMTRLRDHMWVVTQHCRPARAVAAIIVIEGRGGEEARVAAPRLKRFIAARGGDVGRVGMWATTHEVADVYHQKDEEAVLARLTDGDEDAQAEVVDEMAMMHPLLWEVQVEAYAA